MLVRHRHLLRTHFLTHAPLLLIQTLHLSFPSPLRGGVSGWGRSSSRDRRSSNDPPPYPPPQGGREEQNHGAALNSRSRWITSVASFRYASLPTHLRS